MTRAHSPSAWLLAFLMLFSAACGNSNPSSLSDLPPGLVATWYATSLSFDGRDVVAEGMRMKISFTSDGTYDVDVTSDLIDFVCDGVWDCQDSGAFDATPTTLTFDPGDPWETTLSASLTGTDLRLTGALSSGESVDLRFVMPPIPELIGTWTSTELLGPNGLLVSDSVNAIETTLAVNFEADGTYSYAATASDPDEFCPIKVSCTGQGQYTADSATWAVTFDPNTVAPVTMQVIAADSILLILNGGGSNWTFDKVAIPTPGEYGGWYAISMMQNGVETADPYGWNTQDLVFDGVDYQLISTHTNPSDDFMCSYVTGILQCGVGGSYVAGLGTMTLSGDLVANLSMVSTPVTLRLTGSIQGVSADILYIRVPTCRVWTVAMC